MLYVIGILIKMGIVVGISQGAVAYLILVERKIAAWAQDRIGPNRCGPFGLIQPLADGAKFIVKEDVIPDYVNKPLYVLAPIIAIVAATISFAVVPFGPVGATGVNVPFGWFGEAGQNIQFQIAPGLDVGIVYVFAIGSLAVYAVILAGYSSNNKYSFLGGLRSSAQIISYEIPLGMSILGIVLIAGSLDLNTIINWQDGHVWGIVVSPLGFLLFLISSFAETNRLPFDLPEAEQELVGGFHTEYSAMKFGMFFLGEYLNIITTCFLVTILFLGGWDLPYVPLLNQNDVGLFSAILKLLVLLAKVGALILFVMWIRWTLPRFRYDQLMDLAWKRMIPLAILNLVATAAIVQLIRGS
ncbi:MAG TPA: NADH-quinone oxidoreductase subunit NuoH [Isosphaeraceae bacterium]|nr:NADH-quinone oxidoreductase subunit NuoH [Isosphaeraceae bacterium]